MKSTEKQKAKQNTEQKIRKKTEQKTGQGKEQEQIKEQQIEQKWNQKTELEAERKSNSIMEKEKRLQYLKQELSAIGLEATSQQLEQFYQYYEMVVEKNKVMNLTAITEYEEFVKKHFVDSLMIATLISTQIASQVESQVTSQIARQMTVQKGMRLLDIGTGAGFPGIPIKLLFPELEVVLLDSLHKRISFLQEVIEKLELNQITAIHARAEEPAHQKEYREQFDLCVSRAVANLAVLSEYALPYVKPGGVFIAYKSGTIEQELQEARYAIEVLGGEITEVEDFSLPGTDIERTLVHIQKKKQTPQKYPRTAGKPAKEPLSGSGEKVKGTGIIVCGLNGVGKSTLGRVLAERLGFYFLDNEDLYFLKTDPSYPYASSRTREEVEKLFLSQTRIHENFVFASVTGKGYGKEASSTFQYVVWIQAPREVRLNRVRERSFEKFGDRISAEGDLYEPEQQFFELVKSRKEDMVEEWIKTLDCPVIEVDGTKPVEENVAFILEQIQQKQQINQIKKNAKKSTNNKKSTDKEKENNKKKKRKK